MRVTLYSTHCPQCNVLAQKLRKKDISYEEVNDIEVMKEKGFMSAPILEVDGVCMNFKSAFHYIDTL